MDHGCMIMRVADFVKTALHSHPTR
jgi:hypothetical protein